MVSTIVVLDTVYICTDTYALCHYLKCSLHEHTIGSGRMHTKL